jgi:hypothetical protein
METKILLNYAFTIVISPFGAAVVVLIFYRLKDLVIGPGAVIPELQDEKGAKLFGFKGAVAMVAAIVALSIAWGFAGSAFFKTQQGKRVGRWFKNNFKPTCPYSYQK